MCVYLYIYVYLQILVELIRINAISVCAECLFFFFFKKVLKFAIKSGSTADTCFSKVYSKSCVLKQFFVCLVQSDLLVMTHFLLYLIMVNKKLFVFFIVESKFV